MARAPLVSTLSGPASSEKHGGVNKKIPLCLLFMIIFGQLPVTRRYLLQTNRWLLQREGKQQQK
jgi:hypothetical protein